MRRCRVGYVHSLSGCSSNPDDYPDTGIDQIGRNDLSKALLWSARNQDSWHVEPRPWFSQSARAINRGVAVYRHSFSNRAGLAAV